jgi:hypothetical protein
VGYAVISTVIELLTQYISAWRANNGEFYTIILIGWLVKWWTASFLPSEQTTCSTDIHDMLLAYQIRAAHENERH